jgi:hypothetical protein
MGLACGVGLGFFSAEISRQIRSQRFLGSPPKTGALSVLPRGLAVEYQSAEPEPQAECFSAISFLSEFSALKADVDRPPAERVYPRTEPGPQRPDCARGTGFATRPKPDLSALDREGSVGSARHWTITAARGMVWADRPARADACFFADWIHVHVND